MTQLDGIAPCVFGPPLWMFLHLVSFSYPENPDQNTKQNIYNFFKNLGSVLPCSECRTHYEQNFKNLESSLNSRDELTKWVYDLHVLVNIQTGKKNWPSYKEVYEKYSKLKKEKCIPGVCNPESEIKCRVELVSKNNYSENFTENTEDNTIPWCIAIIIILVLIIIGLVYQNQNQKKKR
jgi:hypothetical protein